MATQSVEFSAPPNQTLTVRLFSAGSDTIVQTASSVTAATNRAGIYTAAFTDVAAGVYRLIATNAAGTPLAMWWTDLTLTTATFPAYEMPMSLVQTTVTNSDKTGYSLTPTTGLGNQTSNITGSLSGSVGSVTGNVGGNVVGSVGSVVAGVTVTINNDKTGYTLTVSPPTVSQIVTGVYAALPADHTVAGSYGARFILALNSNRTLQLTGSNHAAADVHEFQPDVLTEAAIADNAIAAAQISADAVTKIQTGLGTLANQVIIAGYLDTEVAAIKSVTDKLNTGLVQDGAVYQFTANMLELAPGGGGGGSATIENQELILDEIDSLRNAFASAVGRLAVSAQLLGFPPSIVRNADYSTVTESEIRLSLKDVDGAAITEIGGVVCSEITWLFGLGSERSPALIEGAATWDDTNNELVIQLAAADTADKPTGILSWQIGCTIDETTRYLGGGTTRLMERHF